MQQKSQQQSYTRRTYLFLTLFCFLLFPLTSQTQTTEGLGLTPDRRAPGDYLGQMALNLYNQWGHLALDGHWQLTATRAFGDLPTLALDLGEGSGELEPLRASQWGFTQNLTLNLQARVNPNIDCYLTLGTQGYWGVGDPSSGSYRLNGTFGPLLLEEAYARYLTESFFFRAGRLHLGGSSMGLLGDTRQMPVLLLPEGMEVAFGIGDWAMGATFARLSTFAAPGSSYVQDRDDLVILQVARGWDDWQVLYEYLPQELSNAKGHLLGWEGQIGKLKLSGEAAAYYPSTTGANNPTWAKAFILASQFPFGRSELSVRGGYVEAGFTPYTTRLSVPGFQDLNTPLLFWANAQGLNLNWRYSLRKGLNLELGGAWINPVAEAGNNAPLRAFKVELAQSLGPLSQLCLTMSRQFLESKPEPERLLQVDLAWEVAF